MLTRDDFLQELEAEAKSTRRALERVPEDKLDWRPHEKSFSLGQLAMHVAMIPGSLAPLTSIDALQVRSPDFPRPSASSRAEILTAFDKSLATARQVVGSLDEKALAAPCRIMAGDKLLVSTPRSTFLRRMLLNHWYHHRGQLITYLRQTGVSVPAMYGPTADEMPLLS